LGLKRSQLRKEVQRYFGFTSTYASLNTSQRCWVDSAITRGLRQFYYPEPLINENYSHSWSFLMPTVVMQTEANADRYTLPLDFGGIEGDLQYVTTTNPGLRSTPIRVTSNHEIDEAVRRDSYLGQDYPRSPRFSLGHWSRVPRTRPAFYFDFTPSHGRLYHLNAV